MEVDKPSVKKKDNKIRERDQGANHENKGSKKTLADLSKRKSFADMQFAEVSGGQPLNFDELDMLEEEDGESAVDKDLYCNGNSKEGEANKEDEDDASACAAGDGMAEGSPAQNQAKTKPDPVFEITSDLQVKIADLGNACWVVSF